MGKMFEKLEAKSKTPGTQETIPTPVPEITPAQDADIGDDIIDGPETKTGESGDDGGEKPPKDGEAAGPAEGPGKDGEKKKVNPWKLLDEWKGRAATLEKQIADLKQIVPDETSRRAEIERLERAEARAKQLEEHIKFVDYTKSEEFQRQYVEPYERSWQTAMAEMKELTVQDVFTGQERGVTPQDLLDLVNLPLGKAREMAEQMFGNFANDVMQHRKEVRGMFEKQQEALEKKKVEGAQISQQRAERFQKHMADLHQFVVKNWEAANASIAKHEKHGKNFTPVDGDTEINNRLAKGFSMVDRAFGENPMNPNLSHEQRAEIIKRQASVRNRAAAYGRLVCERDRALAEAAKLKESLDKINTASPDMVTSQGRPVGQAPAAGSARQRIDAALESRAH
jgi:hypothetical protein